MGVVEHTAVGPTQLAALSDPLERLYRKCFAEPPWSATEDHFAGFPRRFANHLSTPGTHGLVTHEDNSLAAVIYGWPTNPDPNSPFYAAVRQAVAPEARHHLKAPALEVVELMVDPDRRGRGMARTLLDKFASDGPAWLCTHPEAPAAHLYKSAGWTTHGTFTDQAGTPLQVYVLER